MHLPLKFDIIDSVYFAARKWSVLCSAAFSCQRLHNAKSSTKATIHLNQPTDRTPVLPMRSDDEPQALSFSHQSVVTGDNPLNSMAHDGSGFVQVDPAMVDLVLEMTATFDADGYQQPSRVTRSDVVAVLLSARNDVAKAVDEVMTLIAIRQLRVDEDSKRDREQQLQWHELCAGLGVSECDAFMKALNDLPEKEKNELLSTNGGFLQQLLLELDEEESEQRGANADEDHPLAKLHAMYPHYRMDTIENVFEQQNFDVNATAQALYNLRGINTVQSFAAVVSAQTRTAQQQLDLRVNGPRVESMGHFPGLPSTSGATKKLNQKQRRQQQQQGIQSVQRKPNRLAKLNGSHMINAWERQDITSTAGVLESTLSSELKIDRLKSILPSINRGVIQTVLLCSERTVPTELSADPLNLWGFFNCMDRRFS